jgi:hypothetical protein
MAQVTENLALFWRETIVMATGSPWAAAEERNDENHFARGKRRLRCFCNCENMKVRHSGVEGKALE